MIVVESGRNTSHLLIKLECTVEMATDPTAIIAVCTWQYGPLQLEQGISRRLSCHSSNISISCCHALLGCCSCFTQSCKTDRTRCAKIRLLSSKHHIFVCKEKPSIFDQTRCCWPKKNHCAERLVNSCHALACTKSCAECACDSFTVSSCWNGGLPMYADNPTKA